MTPEHDVRHAPEPQTFQESDAPLRDEHASAAASSQEINERRARVENTELLRHLRGL